LVATALLLSFSFNPPLSLTQRTSSQWGDYQKEPSSTLINKTQKKKKKTRKKILSFSKTLKHIKKNNNNNKSRSQKPYQQIDFDNTWNLCASLCPTRRKNRHDANSQKIICLGATKTNLRRIEQEWEAYRDHRQLRRNKVRNLTTWTRGNRGLSRPLNPKP
jgi:hypothetical protein